MNISTFKSILITTTLLISYSAFSENVDMSDPTAVYSSVGAELDSDGDLDIEAGFAFGHHLLSVETKNGMDDLGVIYANMQGGSGVYIDVNGNTDSYSANAGYVFTVPVTDKIAIYPVVMAGFMDREYFSSVTMTAGAYARLKLDNGMHFGVDPFMTVFENAQDDIDSDFSTEVFVGYQLKQHRFRAGYNGGDEEVFFNYKIAF